jgi:hypothetical protein
MVCHTSYTKIPLLILVPNILGGLKVTPQEDQVHLVVASTLFKSDI